MDRFENVVSDYHDKFSLVYILPDTPLAFRIEMHQL